MASWRSEDRASDPYELRPEDISQLEFPLAMRGFERDAVRRKLDQLAHAYAVALRQRDRSRDTAETANKRVAAAEGEIQASARSVAELTRNGARLERELANTRGRIANLEQELDHLRSEQAESAATQSGELEQVPARIAVLEQTPDDARSAPESNSSEVPEQAVEASELLLASVRAAEMLRAAGREEAQIALKKARDRVAALDRRAERHRRTLEQTRAESATLAAAVDRARDELQRARSARLQAEKDAELVRSQVLAAEQLREHVQTLLGTALAALDEDTGDKRSVLDDLASRLQPQPSDPA